MTSIGIIGVGAIGGSLSGFMAFDGEDVTFIDPWRENVDAMRESGLILDGSVEGHVTEVAAYHTDELSQIPKDKKFDVLIVAVLEAELAEKVPALAGQELVEVDLQGDFRVQGGAEGVGRLPAQADAELRPRFAVGPEERGRLDREGGVIAAITVVLFAAWVRRIILAGLLSRKGDAGRLGGDGAVELLLYRIGVVRAADDQQGAREHEDAEQQTRCQDGFSFVFHGRMCLGGEMPKWQEYG